MGTLASGMRHDPTEGTAAVLCLILSRHLPEFKMLPFGSLRKSAGAAGSMIGWIADLYIMIQTARLGGPYISPGLIPGLTQSWPRSSYVGLPTAIVLASGNATAFTTDHARDRSIAHAISDIDDDEAAEWFESLPDDIVGTMASSSFMEAIAMFDRPSEPGSVLGG